MKIIRQSEVYIMEEAVTDQIVKTTKIQIDQTALVGGYDVASRVAPGNHEF